MTDAEWAVAEFRRRGITEQDVWRWMADGKVSAELGEKWMLIAREIASGNDVVLHVKDAPTRKPLPALGLYLSVAGLTFVALCAFVGFVYLWSLL